MRTEFLRNLKNSKILVKVALHYDGKLNNKRKKI